uniref:hypothetical protein n=1 Tax=Lophurella stichidiosa TaxID=2008659 RepID=UPI002551F133|nr:hypothetical protein QQP86_pgp116 [Aphanocladia stichidiosa]WGH13949.1 hypothetical protein [Aphanocladia stichidiosa]
MNLLRYCFSINYIKLKIKIFYKKNIHLTTLIIFILLTILPYISTNILIILICFIKLIFIGLLRSLYINKLFRIFQSISFFFYTILINYLINENNFNQIDISYIPFIYYSSIKLLISNKKIIYKLYFYYIYYQIPEYLRQMILINAIYMILINNIAIFIRSETINKTLLFTYVKINRIKLNLYNISLLNIIISNQILNKIIESITNIYLSIKVKQNNITTKELIKNINSYINRFFNQLLNDQNNISITLWIRLIKNRFKSKIYLD